MRAMITINGAADREKAARWSMATKAGMRIEFKQAKRSGEQNDKLWAMLTEVAAQVPWHGIKLSPDDWKFIFLDALKRELRVVPNIDGTGFVNLGRSSSDLSKAEMSDLIELIHAFGAGHGVIFNDPETISSGPAMAQTETAPAAESAPEPAAGVVKSESSEPSPDDNGGGDGVSESTASSPSLPEGWAKEYAKALQKAQKPISLPKYAAQFWEPHGGWAAQTNPQDRETAVAIYDTFKNHFGDSRQIEALLREII